MRSLIWLCFLILAISALKLQHHNKKTPIQPRVRRSIHVLNQTERKAFFWSLKMLGVLPPPQGFMQWSHNSFLTKWQTLEDYKKFDVKPKCLHDLLIASHKTNMLHKTFFFLSYHKHWQMLYEIWLTFAHNVLSEGKSKLLSVYPKEFYTKNAALWDRVFDEYKSDGCADLKQISAHYWNPTNFLDKRDLIVPIEIASPWDFPKKVNDAVDDLFHAVRGHYSWQYSAKTRLVSEQFKWDVDEIRQRLKSAKLFSNSEEPFHYNQDEQNLLNGKLNPRLQPEGQHFDQFNKTYSLFVPDQNDGRMMEKIQERYRKYFESDGKKENIAVFNITDQQMFIVFGADSERQINGTKSVLKRSYITKKQRLQLNIPYTSMLYYNRRLPHYTFANALFNRFLVPTFKDYMILPHGVENSHSKIHNYHGQPNEVIGLNIFIYHGMVDLMFQMGIRAANMEDKTSKHGKLNYQALKNAYNERHVKTQGFMLLDNYKFLNQQQKAQYQKVVYNDLKQYYDVYFQNNEQIFPKNKSDVLKNNFTEMTTGDWVITEWKHPYLFLQIKENKTVDPNTHAITPGFAIRDFMLTSERIRESSDLNDLYHKSYAKHYGHKYEKFINLSAHNFNYEYEIYDQGKTFLLNEGASNLFKYLQDMKEDLQEDLYDVLMANINSTIDHFYTNSFSTFTFQSEKVNQLYAHNPIDNHLEVKSYLIEHYNSFLRNVSFTFVTYPANKPLGFYDIKVKLDAKTQCAGNFSDRLRGLGISPALISQLQTSGLLLHRLNVRESSNKSYCASCSDDKHIILDLDIDLFQTNRTVWQAIRKIYTGHSPILASSAQQGQNSIGECFTNFGKLFAVEQLQEGERPISPRFVAGAEEIKMTVVVEGDQSAAEGSLEIEVTSVSVNYARKNIRGASIKEFKNIGRFKLDFYRVKDFEEFFVANRINSYLHHGIKVTWHQNNSGKKAVVHYKIPHFAALANIKIVLSGKGVHLQDADYDFKRQLVWNLDEQILNKMQFSE